MSKTPEQVLEAKLFKKICRKAGTTMRDHRMVQEGDHVLVGLSGGKDSLILLKVLEERRRALPFSFHITAAHVEARNVGYHIDKEGLETFCRELNIPLVFRSIEPDLLQDPKKKACFVCSWHRRKALFDLTRELDCNRLALGHHRRDAVETLLMNMIYHGSISSLPHSLSMFEGRVQLIRPLLDLEEGLLEEFADLTHLRKIEKTCPHEDRSKRDNIRSLLLEMERLHGRAAYNIFQSAGKIFTEYLPGHRD
ncbi:MAG: tRNA 2-thiocytidine biosynthesis TtcA family protein [Bacteroidales bacterium]